MWYFYRVADICVLCRTDIPLTIREESREFLFPLDPAQLFLPADLTLTLEGVDELDEEWANGLRIIDRYYLGSGDSLRVYYCLSAAGTPYAQAQWQGKDRIICRYLKNQERMVNLSRNITELLGLETLLLRFDTLLLHAAFVSWQGRGILFTAPSGTGKSTQAALWQEILQGDILNGDRAALGRQNGRWTAWGLPYAGSSGIYRNTSAPLWAIVTLTQGSENEIRRLSAREAFTKLMPELNLRRWDPESMNHAMDLLTALLGQIPVYHLSCRPDREAVYLLRDTLMKENTL